MGDSGNDIDSVAEAISITILMMISIVTSTAEAVSILISMLMMIPVAISISILIQVAISISILIQVAVSMSIMLTMAIAIAGVIHIDNSDGDIETTAIAGIGSNNDRGIDTDTNIDTDAFGGPESAIKTIEIYECMRPHQSSIAGGDVEIRIMVFKYIRGGCMVFGFIVGSDY